MESRFLLYDLSNVKDTVRSLSKFIGVKERAIIRCIYTIIDEEMDYDKYYEKFIDSLKINLNNLSLDGLEIKSIHVTTGKDSNYIAQKGLLNLQNVLKEDTPLNKFLKERDIVIDIENKIVTYKGNKYLIEKDDSFGNSSGLYRKIYSDYLINGFHSHEDPTSYGGGVAYRPEILYNLSKFLNYKSLESEWEKENEKCYIVEYKNKIDDFEDFNFNISYVGLEDRYVERELGIKKWLIKSSIEIIYYDIKGWGVPEIFSYSKFDHNVPSKDIINIIEVTSTK